MTTDVTVFNLTLSFLFMYMYIYIYNMHVMYLPKLKCDDA